MQVQGRHTSKREMGLGTPISNECMLIMNEIHTIRCG